MSLNGWPHSIFHTHNKKKKKDLFCEILEAKRPRNRAWVEECQNCPLEPHTGPLFESRQSPNSTCASDIFMHRILSLRSTFCLRQYSKSGVYMCSRYVNIPVYMLILNKPVTYISIGSRVKAFLQQSQPNPRNRIDLSLFYFYTSQMNDSHSYTSF